MRLTTILRAGGLGLFLAGYLTGCAATGKRPPVTVVVDDTLPSVIEVPVRQLVPVPEHLLLPPPLRPLPPPAFPGRPKAMLDQTQRRTKAPRARRARPPPAVTATANSWPLSTRRCGQEASASTSWRRLRPPNGTLFR